MKPLQKKVPQKQGETMKKYLGRLAVVNTILLLLNIFFFLVFIPTLEEMLSDPELMNNPPLLFYVFELLLTLLLLGGIGWGIVALLYLAQVIVGKIRKSIQNRKGERK